MGARWEGDTRGRGVGEAAQLVSGADELATAFSASGWVAEEPELHLRPHVEAWCQADQRLALTDATVDDNYAYVLELAWRGQPAGVGHARAAVFALIGSFAESATYVRQRRVADGSDGSQRLQFEVATGELAPDAAFEPHGHVVVIKVSGVL
jgi:hypothetical protein